MKARSECPSSRCPRHLVYLGPSKLPEIGSHLGPQFIHWEKLFDVKFWLKGRKTSDQTIKLLTNMVQSFWHSKPRKWPSFTSTRLFNLEQRPLHNIIVEITECMLFYIVLSPEETCQKDQNVYLKRSSTIYNHVSIMLNENHLLVNKVLNPKFTWIVWKTYCEWWSCYFFFK